jgi:hypothetical protein
MGPGPYSDVVVAPHRTRAAPALVLSLRQADWQYALQELGGPANPAALARLTAQRLEELGAPKVALVHRVTGSPRRGSDPVLALAILSRCTANMFLKRRTPRWGWDHFKGLNFRVLDPVLAQFLRTKTWL